MIPVFIGWDSRETVAYQVLVHSLIIRSSEPLAITAVGNQVLPKALWHRERGPFDSTEFSNARFLVPALMGFEGWAIFMDCDMLCLADLAELWAQRQDQYAVMVRKHDYRPSGQRKFLDQVQTRYARKNWSSLMLLNCAHPHTRSLTAEYVNQAAGLDLHGFSWTTEEQIGALRGPWNELAVEGGHCSPSPSLVHFTEGGPWHGYLGLQHAQAWVEELDAMVADANPTAESHTKTRLTMGREALEYRVGFFRELG